MTFVGKSPEVVHERFLRLFALDCGPYSKKYTCATITAPKMVIHGIARLTKAALETYACDNSRHMSDTGNSRYRLGTCLIRVILGTCLIQVILGTCLIRVILGTCLVLVILGTD